MFCMYVNIADVGLSALLVWLLLPRWGLNAYIFVICFTEVFNFALSIGRLRRMACFQLPLRKSLRAVACAAACGLAARLLGAYTGAAESAAALVLSLAAGLGLYCLAMREELTIL